MPCVHCVSGSENSVATFVMNHTYKSVIKSLFKLDFNMRHICTDLSLALGCVAHVHPGLKTHYDQEHIRALAGSKSWQKKIDHRVNRPIIASNISMLCHCRTRVHHQNSIELMVKTWEDKEGMNENRIAAYVRKHYQGSTGRYTSGYWHYDSMNTTGFFPWTQSLDRYHLALKGNSRRQVKAVVRFDVGVESFLSQEIPKLFEFDHRLIVEMSNKLKRMTRTKTYMILTRWSMYTHLFLRMTSRGFWLLLQLRAISSPCDQEGG
jgi:hypothetical protein